MRNHPSSSLITTRKPISIPTPPSTSILILTHASANKKPESYPKNPLFESNEDDGDEKGQASKHQYAMDMDIAYGYPAQHQSRPTTQVETFNIPLQKQQNYPYSNNDQKTYLTGPLVFRVKIDGSPVEEDLNKPLPKDDDLELYHLSSTAFALTSSNRPNKNKPQSQSQTLTQQPSRIQRHYQVGTFPSTGKYQLYN